MAQLLLLTRSNGDPVVVGVSQIVQIRPLQAGGASIILANDKTAIHVKEDVYTIKSLSDK